jgi:hypothetical protein
LTTGQISKTFSSNLFRALSPDGQSFVGVRAEYSDRRWHKSINIVDVGTGQNIKSFSGTDAVLSPDGTIIAIDEDRGSLKLFNCGSTFSSDGKILALIDYPYLATN